jgi:peptidoglycan/LPS O-acetylase OafA/YrhL
MQLIDRPTSPSADLVPPDRFPFMSGLDGLRAIAVMAVVFYHADFSWARGGFLGVEVFFVISGYLITSLLLVEWLKTDSVDLKAFWVRRARRLLPAVFLMLGVVAVWSVVFLRDTLYRLGGDILAASAYVTNWFFIVRNDSYFESFGRPPLLGHLWSLAVEEQFYVLWPVLFSIGFAVLGGRSKHATIRRFRWIVVVGAIASTAWMAHLFVPFEDPSRVYYGTDTRAAGILIGIALATAWMPWRLPKTISRPHTVVFRSVGFAALAGLLLIMATLSEYSPWLYRGGFAVTSLLTAVVIAIIAHPAIGFGFALSNPVMTWIGKRSYGIYLWHWPIFMITRPGFDVASSVTTTFVFRLALTFAIAELSYRYVEMPIRKVGYRVWMRSITRTLGIATHRSASGAAVVTFASLALIVTILVVSSQAEPPGSVVASAEGQSEIVLVTAEPGASDGSTAASRFEDIISSFAQDTSGSSSNIMTGTQPVAAATESANTASASDGTVDGPHITVIGDSVLLGATPDVEAALGAHTVVDGKVNRQFRHADDVARDLRSRGKLGDIVVLHLGTNSPFNSTTWDEVMSELNNEVDEIYVLTIQVPRRWESETNNAIRAGVKRWPNVNVIDYFTWGNAHPDYYVEDGVHLNATGRAEYAKFLSSQING